jgi:hypothetical protein
VRPAAFVLAGAIGLALIGCRATRPAGVEASLQPLGATPREAVILELQRQMSHLHAIRSLMRIRVSSGDRSLSFRARMLVEPGTRRMELVAFTPIGTSAMTILADGDHVVFLDHIHGTAWEGSSAELAEAIGFFDPQLGLAAWGLDIAGFPAQGEFQASEGGLASAAIATVTMVFDPPAFPPSHVTVTRAGAKAEITHLELASTDADVPLPAIPKGYRCCVPPRM